MDPTRRRHDVTVVQCTCQLQGLIDPHTYALSEQFLCPDRRSELTRVLRRVADLVEPALDPLRRYIRSQLSYFPIGCSTNVRFGKVLGGLLFGYAIALGAVAGTARCLGRPARA